MAGWFSNITLESLGAQVSDLTQSIGESAAKMGEDLQQKVNTLAAFDLEEIGKVIQDAEDSIVSEERKLKQEEAGVKQTEVKILPWETRIEQKTILSHGLMEKVLSLSLEESNFTTAPAGADAKELPVQDASPGDAVGDKRHTDDIAPASKFELERHIEVAVKMLSLDPNLAKIHARLISKMPEETFWCHYFSRVAAIRTEVGLEPLCDDLHPEASATSTSEDYDKISHGDVQSMNSTSEGATQTPQHPDDADGDGYSDLGDFDDLDDLDDASNSSIDATLEAEIAAELGES